jgi:predicted transcriptional regulator
MKRELFLQIADIEDSNDVANDVSNVTTNIISALRNNQINSEEANYLIADLHLTLKSLGILK